jgi:hypothetical protein
MNENRAQALGRLLAQLDRFDFFAPPYDSDSAFIRDATSVLKPFLENPERHEKHVAVALEYVQLVSVARVIRPLLTLYNLPFARKWLERRFASKILQPLKSRIQGALDDALGTVEPGELQVDLLPITSVPTKIDWKRQGRRLILIELRGVATPGAGMQLRALSQQVDLTSPPGCQFVDAIPSNEMETLGEREISITERGKFVVSTADSAKLGISSKGPVKMEGALASTETSTEEAEASASEKVSHTPQMARVISSAVGNVAMWRLLRTPSQLLLGTSKFSATALVPSDSTNLGITVVFGADIDGWGPTSVKRVFDVPLPKTKA